MVKNPPVMQETWVQSLGQEDPLEAGMVTHSSILAGKSHIHRSLVGYSPWGHKELDTTELLALHFSSPLNFRDMTYCTHFITHTKRHSDLFSAVVFQMVIQKFKEFLSCGF